MLIRKDVDGPLGRNLAGAGKLGLDGDIAKGFRGPGHDWRWRFAGAASSQHGRDDASTGVLAAVSKADLPIDSVEPGLRAGNFRVPSDVVFGGSKDAGGSH